jgi:hypothetical protein
MIGAALIKPGAFLRVFSLSRRMFAMGTSRRRREAQSRDGRMLVARVELKNGANRLGRSRSTVTLDQNATFPTSAGRAFAHDQDVRNQ